MIFLKIVFFILKNNADVSEVITVCVCVEKNPLHYIEAVRRGKLTFTHTFLPS